MRKVEAREPASKERGLVSAATAAGLTIACAESITAGMLCSGLATVPGASKMLNGGVVAYQNSVKKSVLGVSAELLARDGSVNAEVARQMARGVRRLMGAALAVSTTGVAGPDAHDGEQVGVVFIGLADEYGEWSQRFELSGTREEIREQTYHQALAQLQTAIEAAGGTPSLAT